MGGFNVATKKSRRFKIIVNFLFPFSLFSFSFSIFSLLAHNLSDYVACVSRDVNMILFRGFCNSIVCVAVFIRLFFIIFLRVSKLFYYFAAI